MVGYQGHVIPVVIAVWILAVIEKKLHKIVPEVLDLFVTPLVSVFVTGYLTLSIVGPIFVWAENAILGAIQWMLTLPLGIGSLIMGSLYAPTVVPVSTRCIQQLISDRLQNTVLHTGFRLQVQQT